MFGLIVEDIVPEADMETITRCGVELVVVDEETPSGGRFHDYGWVGLMGERHSFRAQSVCWDVGLETFPDTCD